MFYGPAVAVCILSFIVYCLLAFMFAQYVRCEIYKYTNHSHYRRHFTPWVKRRLRLILVLGFIPGVQFLVGFGFMLYGIGCLLVKLKDFTIDVSDMLRTLKPRKPL